MRRLDHTTNRHGTTLAEVLVSIMILSIGIISLATLFPISILRSLQATQLTNATILRYNAAAQIDVTPGLVDDPNENSDKIEHHFQNYLVDPLGVARGVGDIGALRRHAGLQAFDPMFNPLTAERDALSAVTLPDSWVFQVDGTGTLATATSFTFTEIDAATLQAISTGNEDTDRDGSFDVATEDLNGNGMWDIAESRIVLFDTSGRRSQVRKITGISGQTVSWSGPINYPVGIARIETAEIRYTWMLTVRNPGPQDASGDVQAPVDVVVFFRRSFSPEDNRIHNATFVDGSRNVGVTVTGEPTIKKGGFVLDVQNAHWYRIQDIKVTSDIPPYTHLLEIERPAEGSAGEDFINMNGILDNPPGPADEDLDSDGILDFGGAVFMEGIVEVYSIGAK